MFHGPFDPTPGWVQNTLGLGPRTQSYLTGSCVTFACWLCGEHFDQAQGGVRAWTAQWCGLSCRWKAWPSDSCSSKDVGRSERDTPDPLLTNRREDKTRPDKLPSAPQKLQIETFFWGHQFISVTVTCYKTDVFFNLPSVALQNGTSCLSNTAEGQVCCKRNTLAGKW